MQPLGLAEKIEYMSTETPTGVSHNGSYDGGGGGGGVGGASGDGSGLCSDHDHDHAWSHLYHRKSIVCVDEFTLRSLRDSVFLITMCLPKRKS